MKKKFSFLSSLVIVAAVALCCLFALPQKAKASTNGYYTYTVSGNKATITDCHTSISGAVTIPATLGGYPVTSIGDDAFMACTGLTSVTIGNSVTTIGERAFYYCTRLTGIWVSSGNTNFSSDDKGVLFNKAKTNLLQSPGGMTGSYNIPDSVTFIGNSAFEGCTGLTSITIGNGVTSIGNSAFEGCTGLTSVTIGNGVTSIGNSAFCSCTGLKSVTVPNSVKSIGNSAFGGCTNMTSVTIGDSVTTIGSDAFNACSSLISITIGDSVKDIGDYVFYHCHSLTSVTIGNGVTRIGRSAFEGCTRLKSVTIGNGVTSIGDSAFYSCKELTSVTIGNGVKSIYWGAFYNCSSIENVYYAGSQADWKNISISSGNNFLTSATRHYKHVHNYSVIAPVVVAPTCTEKGYTEYTCIYGENHREYTTALGHSVGSNTQVIAPTCVEDGYISYICGRCGELCGVENGVALGHDYTGPVKIGLAPACETEGWEGASCTRCQTVRKDTVLPETGHNVILSEDTAPTCQVAGSIGGTHCSNCNKVFIKPTEVVALGHSFTNYKSNDNATCIADGTETAKCNRCEERDIRTDEGSATGHSHVAVVTAPTCTEQGYTTHTCNCGDIYVDSYVNALGHSYDSGKVTKAATCKAAGVKTYTCSICKGTKTETIAKLTKHTYSNNCDTACNVCGAKRTITHSYDAGKVTKAATCKAAGVKTYTCKTCNGTKTATIAKLTKHTYSNNCDTTCNVCAAKRTIKHVYSNNCDTACNVCNAKRTIKHTYKTTTTKATLSKNGKTVKKCTVCGKVASTTTIKRVKTVKLSATSYTYNGKAKTPTVTVKDSAGKTLKKGTDYTVTYAKGRKNVGTYKVTVKMKGNYTGTKTLTFKIVPKAASINKLTAKSKAILVKLNRVTTQSTGYQIQYSTSSKFTSAKTVNVTSYKTSIKTISGLKKGKKYYVRVRTYKTVGKTKFYSAWSSYKSIKTR